MFGVPLGAGATAHIDVPTAARACLICINGGFGFGGAWKPDNYVKCRTGEGLQGLQALLTAKQLGRFRAFIFGLGALLCADPRKPRRGALMAAKPLLTA